MLFGIACSASVLSHTVNLTTVASVHLISHWFPFCPVKMGKTCKSKIEELSLKQFKAELKFIPVSGWSRPLVVAVRGISALQREKENIFPESRVGAVCVWRLIKSRWKARGKELELQQR